MKRKILCIAILLCLLCGCKNNSVDSTGRVSFTAVNGLNGIPVENVKIVLPENNITLMTDSDGKTEECNVKVTYDKRYSLEQEYGTFSVFAYKEGYSDYALFYAQIKPDESRKMKIFLFEKDTPIANGAPIAIIESPDENWTKEYMELYK